MAKSDEVVDHYSHGQLLDAILAGVTALGKTPDTVSVDDLAPVDEFHIGGRQASEDFIGQLGFSPDDRVLDVGCGIGGAARYLGAEIGCTVEGIDLTPEYIAVAKTLTAMTGQNDKVSFSTASALDMPFEDAAFDAAITIHAAMNIAARAELYAEIARVLKAGAVFCAYDVMKKSGEDLTFPVPWAQSAETSFLTTPDDMRALLGDAGFEILEVEDRTAMAIDFLQNRSRPPGGKPPPLGTHLVIGASAPVKFKNTLENTLKGRIAPVVMIARRR